MLLETALAQCKLNCAWREGSRVSEQLEKILIQTKPGQKQFSQTTKIAVYKIIYSDLH